MTDYSRIGEKNPEKVAKFHELSCQKKDLKNRIKRGEKGLKMQFERLSKKVSSFWNPRGLYK